MSTICKIVVASTDATQIEKLIFDHISEEHGQDILVDDVEWPTTLQEFVADYEEPTLYCLKALDENFTEIHFNSFGKTESLSTKISDELGAQVLVNIYQSVAEAGYWSLYKEGQLIRAIEFGDGDIAETVGELLEFESEPLGTNISAESEEEFYSFGFDNMDNYNRLCGIDVEVYQDSDKGWRSLRYNTIDESLPVASNPVVENKPWWKFW